MVRRRWRGHELITCGPWCQGPALQQALALVERVGIDGLAHNSAAYLHRIVECLNLAMADREYFFGDPAFVDVPIDHLLDPATIARRAAAVRDDRAFGQMPAPLDRRDTAARGGGGGAAEGGGGHVVLLRGGSLGQRVQRDAVGRLGECAGRAGAGHHAVGPRLAEPARPAPSGRRGARQAAAADAQSGDGAARATAA